MIILLIEDNLKMIENIRYALEKEAYSIDTAINGEEGLTKAIINPYDLIILDIMLPIMDGFSILDVLRKKEVKTPVLVLSAKSEVTDKVKALDLGSYDYMTKPFALSELLARVRSIIRRNFGATDNIFKIDDLVINIKSKEVNRDGKTIRLTAKEYQILEFLAFNKDSVVNRVALEEHIWGESLDLFTASNIIDVHLKNLRKKINEGHRKKLIYTRRGLGFILTDKFIKEDEE